MFVIIGLICVGIAWAARSKMKFISIFFGIVAFLCAIVVLREGAGFNAWSWIENPGVNVPDNIPLPGK